MSFEIPKALTFQVRVYQGRLCFNGTDYSAFVSLPRRESRGLQQEAAAILPSMKQLTTPRLMREIFEAQSSDFSFLMSRDELRWHKWLLWGRAGGSVESLEYVCRSDLEGNLLMSRDFPPVFNWTTLDSKWKGSIHFRPNPPNDLGWVRHMCSTLKISRDELLDFHGTPDGEAQEMVQFTPIDH